MKSVPESLKVLIQTVQESEGPDIGSPSGTVLEQRVRAISALGDYLIQSPHPAGHACLVDFVRENCTARLVNHAVSVLGRIQETTALSVVIDVLLATHVAIFDTYAISADESLRLRCNAAMALGKIQDERAIVPLMSILNDRSENYRLRLAAAESLGKLGSDFAVTPLIDILADDRESSVYLKESVAKALGMLGDIRALEPLIDTLNSKRGIAEKFNFLKEQAIEAIARIGRPTRNATESLLLVLNDDAPSIRLAAVEALGSLGDEGCVPALSTKVFDEDDDVAKAAINAIYGIGGEDAVRQLLKGENLPQFLREELEGYIP